MWGGKGGENQINTNTSRIFVYFWHMINTHQQDSRKHWRCCTDTQVLQKLVKMTHDNQLKHIIPILNSTATAKTAHGKGWDTRVWPGRTGRWVITTGSCRAGVTRQRPTAALYLIELLKILVRKFLATCTSLSAGIVCITISTILIFLSNKKKTIYIEQLKHKRLWIVVQ